MGFSSYAGAEIGKGLQSATDTLLQIQMYKQKMSKDKEDNKIEQNYKKAQTDFLENKLSAVEEGAQQQAAVLKFLFPQGVPSDNASNNPNQPNAPSSPVNNNKGVPPVAGNSAVLSGRGGLPNSQSQNPMMALQDRLKQLPQGMEVKVGGMTFKNPDKAENQVLPQDIPIPKFTDSKDVKEAYLSRLDPLLQNAIDQVGTYKEGDNTVSAYSRGQGGLQKWQFNGLVKMRYPDWNEQKYASSMAYRKLLSSGRLHDNVLALNTLAGHIDSFNQVIQQYKDNKLPAKQAMVAMAQQITGNAGITDFNVAKNVVETETEALLTKAAVTQQGMQERRKMLGGGIMGPGFDNLEQYAKSVAKIAAIRGKNMETDFKKNTFSDPTDEIIDPDSRNIYNSLAPDVKFLSDETGGGNPDIQDKISQANRLVQQNPQNKGESDSDYKKRIKGMIGNQ